MNAKGVGRQRAGGRQLVLWAAVCAAAPVVGRADANYVGGAGVGQWSTATNWSPVGVPSTAALASMRHADGLNRTLDYDYAGPAVKLGGVDIDQTGSGTSTLQISGLVLSTSYTSAGFTGTGGVVQTGGTNASDAVWLGFNPGSRGTYSMSGGQLGGPAAFAGVGWGGEGTFVHTGGTSTLQVLFLGYQATSRGTYQLSGSGVLTVSEWEGIGGGDTNGSRAVFEQSGGTHTTKAMGIRGLAAGDGTYRLSGTGVLTADVVEAIEGGGVFEQSGGTNTVNNALEVYGGANAPGVFTLSGGTLRAKTLSVGSSSGTAGPGTMTVTGGTATFSGSVTVARAGGVLNVSGGSIATPSVKNDGVVNLSGMALAAAMVNGGTVRASAGAALTVTGGISGSNAASTAAARLEVETGATVVADFVRQGTVALNNVAVNPPVQAPVLAMRRKADGGGTSVVGTLAIGSDSTGLPSGLIDLTDNALVVDYIFAGQSPIANVRRLIGAAWAGGTWTGNGLGSSVAAGRAGRGLGYAEASAVLGLNGGTFEGQAVDSTSVLVKYTVMGDATLNGGVNFDDLLALAKHYNGTNAVWSDGDFNYDGVVNFDDLLVLARNYNGTLAGPVPGAPVGFGADVAAAFAQAAVPEPGGVAGVGMLGVGLAGRRWRRRARVVGI